ncbi:MAG TPA: HDIG domain-containing protein [Gemmataceae bacterium]|nr:HDIG domain-containing protein [Gemmataceae bacterium]
MFGPFKKPSRLSQWDGRRRSSRSDDPVLPQLFCRAVLLRLGAVLLTVLGATYLAHDWGGLMSYRVGEVRPYDLRARVYFEVVDEEETARKRDEAVQALPVEQQRDHKACESVRKNVLPVVKPFPPGTLLVERDFAITDSQYELLQAETHAFWQSQGQARLVGRSVSIFLVFTLLALLVILYVIRFQEGLASSLHKIVGVCALVLLTLVLGLFLCPVCWHAVLIPLTVTALILTIAYNPPFALLMSLSLTLAMIVTLGGSLSDLLVAMGGQATAILTLRNVRTRTRLVEIGVIAGVAYLAMTVATELYSGQTWSLIVSDSAWALVWGTLAGFLVSGLLPLVERLFAIITDVSLLELGDGSHPLLQELVRRAPGTYTHSMTVATLAEPCAEAIGANPLLARVGSYFHDIGKMLKPQYFIENQTGENRHDSLEPALSTLIIIGHVKDGVALAEQYRLPRPIIEFIQQHHGTTLVEYFYREALRIHESQCNTPARMDGQPHPLEPTFRYPGPKPQNRENGIVMLSDAVESSSRALSVPTPGSLRKLVHDLLMKRLLDGQFEESGLTLTELHIVEETLCKGLIALYHSRIKYPEAATNERRAS